MVNMQLRPPNPQSVPKFPVHCAQYYIAAYIR